eukprot:gene12303-2245_t
MNQFDHPTLLEIKSAFSRFDKDGTGIIKAENLTELMRSLGYNPTQAELDEDIKQYGPLASDPIDFPELLDIMAKRMSKKDSTSEDIIHSFNVFDTNDGRCGCKNCMKTHAADAGGTPVNVASFLTKAQLEAILRSLPTPMPEHEIQLFLREAEVTAEKPLNYPDFIRRMMGNIQPPNQMM